MKLALEPSGPFAKIIQKNLGRRIKSARKPKTNKLPIYMNFSLFIFGDDCSASDERKWHICEDKTKKKQILHVALIDGEVNIYERERERQTKEPKREGKNRGSFVPRLSSTKCFCV